MYIVTIVILILFLFLPVIGEIHYRWRLYDLRRTFPKAPSKPFFITRAQSYEIALQFFALIYAMLLIIRFVFYNG